MRESSSAVRAPTRALTWLLVGVLVGAFALTGVLWPMRGARMPAFARNALLASALALILLDVWAVIRRRGHPVSLQRQTPKRFAYQIESASVVGFLWGVDVGTGVSTIRVTSGIWVLILGIVGGWLPVYSALVYGAVFATSVLVLSVVAVGSGNSGDKIAQRVAIMSRRRRLAQIAYVLAALPALAAAVPL